MKLAMGSCLTYSGTPGFTTLTLGVALSFTIHAITGCNTSAVATRHLDKYDSVPYVATMNFAGDRFVVMEAAAGALERKGFVITLMAPDAGILNAEWEGSTMLPEEQKEADGRNKSTVLDVMIAVLLILLVIGIVAALSNPDDDAETTESGLIVDDVDRVETRFLYTVRMTLTQTGPESTEVLMSTEKEVLEDGEVRSSIVLMNKYLNLSVFDDIRTGLVTLQQHGDLP